MRPQPAVIPGRRFERQIAASGHIFKTGNLLEHGHDAFRIGKFGTGHVLAVGTRIGGQFLFIERLRGIQHFLGAHAVLRIRHDLERGQTVRQGRLPDLQLFLAGYNNAGLA